MKTETILLLAGLGLLAWFLMGPGSTQAQAQAKAQASSSQNVWTLGGEFLGKLFG